MQNKNKVLEILQDSMSGKLGFENQELTGLSGRKLIGLLQGFAKNLSPEESYLEVGVFQGLTLLSVAMVIPENRVMGIDNFKQFDKAGTNQEILLNRMTALKIKNAVLINEDYEEALEKMNRWLEGKKIGLYFVDGPHDYRSQLLCLLMVRPWLSENAVIVIDDSNYHHVRQANQDFLMVEKEFKLIFESYTEAHPHNLADKELQSAKDQWWNGINVIIRDRENKLTPIYPETSNNRILFENDHILHASKYPESLPDAASIMNVVKPLQLLRLFNRLLRLRKSLSSKPLAFRGKNSRMNTFSNGLPFEKINPSLMES